MGMVMASAQQNPTAIFQEAVRLCKADQKDEALQMIETLLQYQPQHRMGLFVRGAIRIQNDQVREAMLDWEAAFEGTDSQAPLRVQQQYPELVESAINHFAFETTVDPNDAVRHAAYGRACRYFGRTEAAERHLLRAFELDIFSWREALMAIDIQKSQGQHESAQKLLTKVAESVPDSPELEFRLAVFHQQSNQTAFALRHLEKAVNLDPTHAEARYALGVIYLQQQRLEQAITQFNAVIKSKPSAAAHCRLAETFQQMYQFEEALRQYKLAADLEPTNFKLLADLGALALQFGDFELGTSSLRKALELDSNHPDIHAHLAKAALTQGDLEEASARYQSLLNLQPQDVFALKALGGIYVKQQTPHAAIPLLQKALELQPSDTQVPLDLANAHRMAGDDAAAQEVLTEASDRHPNNREISNALHILMFGELPPESSPSAEPAAPAVHSEASLEEIQAPSHESVEPPPPQLDDLIAPEFEEMWELAQMLQTAAKHQEALTAYRTALSLEPGHLECTIGAGQMCLYLHDFTNAYSYYTAACTRDCDNSQAVLGLCQAADRLDEATQKTTAEKLFQAGGAAVSHAAEQAGATAAKLKNLLHPPAQPAMVAAAAAPAIGNELLELQRELFQMQKEIASRSSQLQESEHKLNARKLELDSREEKLQQNSRQLEQHREKLQAFEQELKNKEQQLQLGEQALELQRAQLAKLQEQLESQAQAAAVAAQRSSQEDRPTAPESPAKTPMVDSATASSPVRPDVEAPASLAQVESPVAAPEVPACESAAPLTVAADSTPEPGAGDVLASQAPVDSAEIEPCTTSVSELDAPSTQGSPQEEQSGSRESAAAAPSETPAAEETAPLTQSAQSAPSSSAAVETAPSSPATAPDSQASQGTAPTVNEEFADLAALSLALDANPDIESRIETAWALSNSNEADFLALFRELARSLTADPRHCRNFAQAYLKLQRPLLAVVQYQKYLQKCPTFEGYQELAEVYRKMNRQSNADECLRKAAELSPA